MVLVNGIKYACERCIRGHRVTSCSHTDQPLTMIKPKGRPTTQCSHCREHRKLKSLHTSCVCGKKKINCGCHSSGNCTCTKKKKISGIPHSTSGDVKSDLKNGDCDKDTVTVGDNNSIVVDGATDGDAIVVDSDAIDNTFNTNSHGKERNSKNDSVLNGASTLILPPKSDDNSNLKDDSSYIIEDIVLPFDMNSEFDLFGKNYKKINAPYNQSFNNNLSTREINNSFPREINNSFPREINNSFPREINSEIFDTGEIYDSSLPNDLYDLKSVPINSFTQSLTNIDNLFKGQGTPNLYPDYSSNFRSSSTVPDDSSNFRSSSTVPDDLSNFRSSTVPDNSFNFRSSTVPDDVSNFRSSTVPDNIDSSNFRSSTVLDSNGYRSAAEFNGYNSNVEANRMRFDNSVLDSIKNKNNSLYHSSSDLTSEKPINQTSNPFNRINSYEGSTFNSPIEPPIAKFPTIDETNPIQSSFGFESYSNNFNPNNQSVSDLSNEVNQSVFGSNNNTEKDSINENVDILKHGNLFESLNTFDALNPNNDLYNTQSPQFNRAFSPQFNQSLSPKLIPETNGVKSNNTSFTDLKRFSNNQNPFGSFSGNSTPTIKHHPYPLHHSKPKRPESVLSMASNSSARSIEGLPHSNSLEFLVPSNSSAYPPSFHKLPRAESVEHVRTIRKHTNSNDDMNSGRLPEVTNDGLLSKANSINNDNYNDTYNDNNINVINNENDTIPFDKNFTDFNYDGPSDILTPIFEIKSNPYIGSSI